MKGLAILSGGADSTTLVCLLKREGHDLSVVSFDYGQRHRRELDSARAVALHLGLPHDIIDLSAAGKHLTGSALTDSVAVPHGHYHEETMRRTVVPNRNAIMLSVAWGIATARGCDFVAYGAHTGDHYIYPDCRQEFCLALAHALRLGNITAERPQGMELWTPLIGMSKGEVIALGVRIGAPYELTWTCYEGGVLPCGKCGACTERAEAFAEAGIADPALAVAA